jgi:hypothetical protein
MNNLKAYAVIADKATAQSLIDKIDDRKKFSGGSWSEPLPHPTNSECLIPVDWSQLSGCEDLFSEYDLLSKQEAKRRGWYFGPFTGAMARETQKLEDIHFLFDAVSQAYGSPNFPAVRALILSFLSACYSLKESLKKKSQNQLSDKLSLWWKKREYELSSQNDLLHQFERFMNTEKHGGALAGQMSDIDLEATALITTLIVREFSGFADPKTLTISAEGAFMTAFAGTPMERRFPVGLHEAKYEITVSNAPQMHLGKSISGASLLQMLKIIRDYYANLVFDAKCLLAEEALP